MFKFFLPILITSSSNHTSKCILLCSKIALHYGESALCKIKNCLPEDYKSLKYKVSSYSHPVYTEVTKNNDLKIFSPDEKEKKFNSFFFNPDVRYWDNRYHTIKIESSPPIFNTVYLSLYTDAISEISPSFHSKLKQKVNQDIEAVSTSLEDLRSPVAVKTRAEIRPFYTLTGEGNSKSTLSRILRTGSKVYRNDMVVLVKSPFVDTKQRLVYSVGKSSEERKAPFKLKLYMDDKCRGKDGDENDIELKINQENAVLCDESEGDRCRGEYGFSKRSLCVVITCNDSFKMQKDENKDRCVVDYSFQFVVEESVSEDIVLDVIRKGKTKMPFRNYVIIFSLVGLMLGLTLMFVCFMK